MGSQQSDHKTTATVRPSDHPTTDTGNLAGRRYMAIESKSIPLIVKTSHADDKSILHSWKKHTVETEAYRKSNGYVYTRTVTLVSDRAFAAR